MASSFPNAVLNGVLLFQTTTILWRSNSHGEITAIIHTVGGHIFSIVSFKRIRRMGHCLLWRDGRGTCIRTNHHLNRSRRSISWWALVCMQFWKMCEYFMNEFRKSVRCCLEEFTSTVMSMVAAHSKLVLGVSCFCAELVIRSDKQSAFFLTGPLLDGLIACGWQNRSNVKACKV